MKTLIEKEINTICNTSDLEAIRIKYLGKNGEITAQMKTLGKLPPEERKAKGAELNVLKNLVENLIEAKKETLETKELNAKLQSEKIDITLPVREKSKGSIHPITQVIEEVCNIMRSMGFEQKTGPEIEDDWHNFEALNFPQNHPARLMHDTFFLSDGHVLRTHTSPVQIRTMENEKPPFRIFSLGKTYRCDSDATHTPMFHQVEGLYVDKDINMGHLKGCLSEFLEKFFGVKVPLRFRPSYFPFTEPSAEVDVQCMRSKTTIKIGEGDGWLELLGCGMVNPNVLKNVGVDPEEYQGFAFGLGIDRIAMLKYGIPDLRDFFEADSRWLNHYGFGAFE